MIFASVISSPIYNGSIFKELMRNTATILIMLLLVVSVSACRNQTLYKPKPFGLTGPSQDAPENYLDGWNDGCETGIGTMSTTWYKTFYGYKINTHMMEDAEYSRAWRDAYTYCRHFAFKSLWDGSDKLANKALDEKICVFCMFR